MLSSLCDLYYIFLIIACDWNTDKWKGSNYVQIPIWSKCCFGLPISSISLVMYCSRIQLIVLFLQRKVSSQICLVQKPKFLCFLQHCLVSTHYLSSNLVFSLRKLYIWVKIWSWIAHAYNQNQDNIWTCIVFAYMANYHRATPFDP